MNKQLQNLLSKQFLTIEELELVEEDTEVIFTEDCGSSGQYAGYHWFVVTVAVEQQEEYDVYISY